MAATRQVVHQALRPGGRLAFESRDPGKKAWLEWNRDQTYRRVVIPSAGPVQTCTDLTKIEGSLVSIRKTWSSTRSVTHPTGPGVSSSSSPAGPRDDSEITWRQTRHKP